jgi:hypothetical protein
VGESGWFLPSRVIAYEDRQPLYQQTEPVPRDEEEMLNENRRNSRSRFSASTILAATARPASEDDEGLLSIVTTQRQGASTRPLPLQHTFAPASFDGVSHQKRNSQTRPGAGT